MPSRISTVTGKQAHPCPRRQASSGRRTASTRWWKPLVHAGHAVGAAAFYFFRAVCILMSTISNAPMIETIRYAIDEHHCCLTLYASRMCPSLAVQVCAQNTPKHSASRHPNANVSGAASAQAANLYCLKGMASACGNSTSQPPCTSYNQAVSCRGTGTYCDTNTRRCVATERLAVSRESIGIGKDLKGEKIKGEEAVGLMRSTGHRGIYAPA